MFRGHELKQKTEMTWPLRQTLLLQAGAQRWALLDSPGCKVAVPHGQGENAGLGGLGSTLKNICLGCGSWSGGLLIAEVKREGQGVGRLFRVAGVTRAGMRGEAAVEQRKCEVRWPWNEASMRRGGQEEWQAGRRRRSHRRQGGREVRQARGKGGMRQDQHERKQLRGGAEARRHCEAMQP